MPFGQPIEVNNTRVIVVRMTRPANDIVQTANMFNSEPEAGNEFAMIEVTLQCLRDASQTCSANTFQFTLVGNSGVVRDADMFVAGVDGLLEGGDFFGGAQKSGKLFFEIGISETNLVMIYDPLSLFDPKVYLEVR